MEACCGFGRVIHIVLREAADLCGGNNEKMQMETYDVLHAP